MRPISSIQFSRHQAIFLMGFAAVLVSTGGVVVSHVDLEKGLEVSFWRSLFAAGALAGVSVFAYGIKDLYLRIRSGGLLLLFVSLMWAVMFTAFMGALSLTTVANVLVVISLDPLLSAVAARFVLKHPVRTRTWICGTAACAGIVLMFKSDVQTSHLAGMAVACLIPLASSATWTVSQHVRTTGGTIDLMPALLIGSVLASAFAFLTSHPLQASTEDIAVLAALGLLQCALPGAIMVMCARTLEAPELALLALLEVAFGVTLVWIAGYERLSTTTIFGVVLVVVAVLLHEILPRKGSLHSHEGSSIAAKTETNRTS